MDFGLFFDVLFTMDLVHFSFGPFIYGLSVKKLKTIFIVA